MSHAPRLSSLPLLVLLLASPRVGLAQPADAPEQAHQEQAAPEQALQQEAPRQPRELEKTAEPGTRPSQAARLGAELGLGLVTSLGGMFIGLAMIGPNMCAVLRTSEGCMPEGLAGLGLGVMLTAPLGVNWGGSLVGADGGLDSAYLGALVGGGVFVLLGMATLWDGPGILALMISPIAAYVGSIIGYEHSVSPERPKVALGDRRIQPLLSISPHGGFVGLGGSF
jgi:hypothetical protein